MQGLGVHHEHRQRNSSTRRQHDRPNPLARRAQRRIKNSQALSQACAGDTADALLHRSDKLMYLTKAVESCGVSGADSNSARRDTKRQEGAARSRAPTAAPRLWSSPPRARTPSVRPCRTGKKPRKISSRRWARKQSFNFTRCSMHPSAGLAARRACPGNNVNKSKPFVLSPSAKLRTGYTQRSRSTSHEPSASRTACATLRPNGVM